MNLGPHVYIVSGSKARQIVGNLIVSFTVSAFDREDGRLEGTNVVWRSSVSGLLGTGSALSLMADTLSEGRHVITVTAKDRNGRTGGATTEVTIVRDTWLDHHHP